jgi:hypothetical protein
MKQNAAAKEISGVIGLICRFIALETIAEATPGRDGGKTFAAFCRTVCYWSLASPTFPRGHDPFARITA